MKDSTLTKAQLIDELQKVRAKNSILKDSHQLYMNGPVVIFKWHNTKGWPVEYVSSNVFQLLGYTDEEFIKGKKNYADIIVETDFERVTVEVEQASQQGVAEFDHQPYRISHIDGTEHWVYDHTVVFRNKNNEITHYYGYIFDINNRQNIDDTI